MQLVLPYSTELTYVMASKKPGKYDHLIDGLPKMLGTEDKPGYQDKVNAYKLALGGVEFPPNLKDAHTDVTTAIVNVTVNGNPSATGLDLARAYELARKADDKLAELVSAMNLHLLALEQMMQDSKERGDVGWGDFGAQRYEVRLQSGATVSARAEPRAVVKDRDAFRKWCMANGYEESMQLPWMTTNSVAKELLLEEQPLPDGVEVYQVPKVAFRK